MGDERKIMSIDGALFGAILHSVQSEKRQDRDNDDDSADEPDDFVHSVS